MSSHEVTSAPKRKFRWLLAAAITLQFLWVEWAVLSARRFTRAPVPPSLIAAAVLAVHLVAVWLLFSRGRRYSKIAWSIAITGVAATFAAMTVPAAAMWHVRRKLAPPPNAERDARLQAVLREVAAAEEQFRRVSRHYTSAADSLRPWLVVPPSIDLSLTVHDSSGWFGRATTANAQCSEWVRDRSLQAAARQVEGVPLCESDLAAGPHQHVETHLAESVTEYGFVPEDVYGEWRQHRVDASRRATQSGSTNVAVGWTQRVGGTLRSPVAIAGNQVFVGAHGNGEFVALDLADGRLGYRIRVPNWIHHEPVVTDKLVIVSFGNSEIITPGIDGSPPSGIIAYDRMTGVERWRRYTVGSVMTTPVTDGRVVAVVTGGNEAVAWHVEDGSLAWRDSLPGVSPMGNPVLIDSTIVVGLELRTACALELHDGRVRYCRSFTSLGRGAGHASMARWENLALMTQTVLVYGSNGSPGLRRNFGEWFRATVRMITGTKSPQPETTMKLIGFDWRTGARRWETPIGTGADTVFGHFAGTPSVVDSIAYVPVPMNGAIVAVRADSGRMLWSTRVKAARGSVLVANGAVLAATSDGGFVVLDAGTGAQRCRQTLPRPSDRAGPTLVGQTAILTLIDGTVMARPLSDWLACRA